MLRRFDIHESYFTLPRRDLDSYPRIKLCGLDSIGIGLLAKILIGRDSYPHSPLQARPYCFLQVSISRKRRDLEIKYCWPRNRSSQEFFFRHCIGSALLCRFYIRERFHPPPQRFGDKIEQMWIIGRDSYPHCYSPLQGQFFSKIRPYC